MAYYYLRESGGAFTNIQLYALRQATQLWRRLKRDYSQNAENTEQLKERCVFIVAALGLSVSQLLGQNNPKPASAVPPPLALLRAFAAAHNLSPDLVSNFERLNYFYNGCRHFGATTEDGAYRKVDELTFEVTARCVDTALRVWRAVLAVHRSDPDAFLDHFSVDRPADLRDIFYEDDAEPPNGVR